MLEQLRNLAQTWRASVDQLEADLETALQRRTFLQEAPLPWDEVADNVLAVMRRHGEVEFGRHLLEKLRPAVDDPLDDLDETLWRPGVLGNITTPQNLDPFILFHILREPISEAIRQNIVSLPPLPNTGPPRAERVAELAKLDREIEKLRTKIEGEREAAEAAGLDLRQISTRESVRKPNRPAK